MHYLASVVCAVLLAGCRSESTPHEVRSSFSDVFVTTDSGFASGTNLCLVLHARYSGAEALDALVAQHAPAAIVEARRVSGPFVKVIFLVKDSPDSQYCVSAGFTVSGLETIARNAGEGKPFDSFQSWPSSILPERH